MKILEETSRHRLRNAETDRDTETDLVALILINRVRYTDRTQRTETNARAYYEIHTLGDTDAETQTKKEKAKPIRRFS